MRKKILVLCLMASLFANAGYACPGFACSPRTSRIAVFVTFQILFLGAISLIVVGTHPKLGNAWADTSPPCGSEKALCIDGCTHGCRNAQNQMCEPFGKNCDELCMLTVENYTFVSSVSTCPHNGCQGGSACIVQGQAVVPENLHTPHDQGTIWGRAMLATGFAMVIAGVSALMVKTFC